MQLKDIMTPNPEIVSVDMHVSDAAQRMKALDVGFLPIWDGTEILGVITDRDVALRVVAEGKDPKTTRIGDAMSTHVHTLSEDADVMDAAKVMEHEQVRRILVTDRNGRCVGVVSLGDLAVRMHNEPVCGQVLEDVSEPARPRI